MQYHVNFIEVKQIDYFFKIDILSLKVGILIFNLSECRSE